MDYTLAGVEWVNVMVAQQALEWHAVASNDGPIDIWHVGAHVWEWTDSTTWDELQHTFGRFDADDAQRAFEATIKLYSELGHEIAAAAGLEYSQRAKDGITAISPKSLSRKL